MSAELIVVDLDYIDGLKTRVDGTTKRLRTDRPNNASIPSDHQMDDRLHDFQQRWDKRRGELADTLGGVAEALQAIHEAFGGVDDKLYGQITCQP